MISARKRPLMLGAMLLLGLASHSVAYKGCQETPAVSEDESWSEALAINDDGQIVGGSRSSAEPCAR